MATPVKTFPCRIQDEYGGDYPQAIVAIRAAFEDSQKSFISDDCTSDYEEEVTLDAVTYKANYWYTAQTKAQGKRSRPLIADDGGDFDDTFIVDLEHPEVVNIMNSGLGANDKIFQVIKSDLTRKFR